MLNYVTLTKNFPDVEEMEPDLELIKFGYASICNGRYLSNMDIYIAMLKYILVRNPEEYEEEYRLLYSIYHKVYLS